MKNSEEILRESWDTIKKKMFCVMRVPEGKERENWAERLYEEITAGKFPSLERDKDSHIHKAHRSPESTERDLLQTHDDKTV